MKHWPVGAHVVYNGKSYRFPGEVTMRDDTGVVVKAFGDMDGNYTGMKHIYADHVLEAFSFSETPFPPLVIFPDDNPIQKIRDYLARHEGKESRALAFLGKLIAAGEEAARERAATPPHDYHPSTLHMGDCSICGNMADHPNHVKR